MSDSQDAIEWFPEYEAVAVILWRTDYGQRTLSPIDSESEPEWNIYTALGTTE